MNINKQDKVTIAVDKANEFLNPLGLCVGTVNYIDDEHAKKLHNKEYGFYNGKMYTVDTIEELLKQKEE